MFQKKLHLIVEFHISFSAIFKLLSKNYYFLFVIHNISCKCLCAVLLSIYHNCDKRSISGWAFTSTIDPSSRKGGAIT
jgi:hypothetical protein